MRNGLVSQIRTASGLNLLLGFWLIIAPFLLRYAFPRSITNDVTIGITIAILAAARLLGAYRAAWLSWFNAFLGLWLIIAPFALLYGSSSALWNDVIVGLIVLSLGVWSAMASRRPRPLE
ncbi:SPW repeat protein [Myxosarcina sp. GI1]|uniref:SPW repeat protein n=1 Tax=Myxosarcina sp. GI1 TaxID=1541065 RepID=UPI00068EF721|nr:SPW repeat protein [Myxosarcina sp. GI1]